MSKTRSHRFAATRHGFTLVEVVVALLLLAITAIGVASTATFVARLAGTARLIAAASRDTAAVMDSIRALPCGALATGAATTPSGVVNVAVVPAPGIKLLRAQLTPASVRLVASVIEESAVPCE